MSPEIPHLLAGVLLLFFGRRFFWLFVGLVGYLFGFEFATEYLSVEPRWLAVGVAALVGVAAAVLAMFFQLVAAGVAGFGAGLYVATALMGLEPAWVAVLCGAVGVLIAVAIFGWALVLLSALAGAAALVDSFDLEPAVRLIVFVILAALGIAFQSAGMQRSSSGKRQHAS
ncbi:MAG: hypothetical protein VCE43_16680 [Myxococcota bacterium]